MSRVVLQWWMNVVKKRVILSWDNRVRPESIERQNVYNDQRLVFCSGWWKEGDFWCGQAIKRVDIEARVTKVRLLSLETKRNVPPVSWEFVRKDQSNISPKVMIHNNEIAGEKICKSVGTTVVVDTRQANSITPWHGLLICKWYVDRGYVWSS